MRHLEIVYKLENISAAAQEFLNKTDTYKVFTFSGELGAGKTTFIAALCREWGVAEIVSSPTFAVVQQYTSERAGAIYHLDLYRIKDEQEAIHSGLEDCLISGNICLVEWPENAPGILPSDTVHTDMIITEKQGRKLLIQLPE